MRMRMGSSILQFIFRGMKGGGRRMSTSSIGKISSPWLMLPSEALYSKFYSLPETKVVSIKKEAPPPPWAAQGEVEHLGCSHGWVASYNNDNRQTFLSDPITGRHIKLPDVHTLPSLYSPDFRSCPQKIILSSPPAAHDCRAIMTYGPSFRLGIAVCFIAHTSTTWLPVCGQGSYSEPVYSTHHNRLFCIAEDEAVECWDLESPSFVWKSDLCLDEDNKGYDSNKYLMTDEHSGRLFLVIRNVLHQVGRDGSYVKSIVLKCGDNDECYPHKTTSFEVYEIDAKDGTMSDMDASLDGLAMFVASNHSFVMPAGDLNLRPDSIYFTDELTNIYEDGGCNHDIGIFDYVDRKVSSIYYPSHVSQISHTLAPTMWFTPSPH